MLGLTILVCAAAARPLDTGDAATIGARGIQVESGVALTPGAAPSPEVAAGAGLTARLDLLAGASATGARPGAAGVGLKGLLRAGGPQGAAGPALAAEAFADPLAGEVAGALMVSQALGGVTLHAAGDLSGAGGALTPGLGLAVEGLGGWLVAEARVSGGTPSALVGLVAAAGEALAVDAALLWEGAPAARVGLTWSGALWAEEVSPELALLQ